MEPYEILDHPADIGLKIRGRTLEELFRHASRGFFDLVTDLGAFSQAGEQQSLSEAKYDFTLEAAGLSDLMHLWLRELVYVFSAKRYVLLDFSFLELSETRLRAHGTGSVFDPRRDEQKLEVKAVTHHCYFLERRENRWEVQVIFDI